MAPATDQVLVGFGQQVVNGVDPLRIDLPQRLPGEVVAGVQEGVGRGAGVFGGGCPAKVFLVIAVQRGTAAGVARVEEEVLHVDRDEFLGAAGLVEIRAADDLAVVLLTFTPTTDVLLPAGQVQQAWVVTQGKATPRLATALIRDADQSRTVVLSCAALDQHAFGA
ncbi:hypothetical protein D3C84_640510 [compost metagenome]